MDNAELTVVRQGMRVVGDPVGTEQFKCDFVKKGKRGARQQKAATVLPNHTAAT